MKPTRRWPAAPYFIRHMIAAILIGTVCMSPYVGIARSADNPLTIVALGDSLTAGYMLQPSESFPAQLQMALQAKGHKVQIVNAGVSGDTSAGGLDRLEWSLEPRPDAVILELGANDALRGTDPKITKDNLDKIISKLTASRIPVLLAGMKAPGNWGADFVKAFDAIYPSLAEKHAVPLYPFFLEGVALDGKLVMADGLHPTAQGIAEIVRRILPDVEALVARAAALKSAVAKD
jgi:acyl-CoA thioesterase I